MQHTISEGDRLFQRSFEALDVAPSDFDHAAHVRLAYIYLCQHAPDAATDHMKRALLAFVDYVGVGRSKFHETITQAWILAVRHFMDRAPYATSADAFIAANPRLLDTRIMFTHYSAERLFSQEARGAYVPPDLAPIPAHG